MIIAKITINDNRFFLFESKPTNIDLIDKLLTFEDTSECFLRGRFDRTKIKYIHFITRDEKNPTAALVPIGFLHDVEKYLKKNSGKYKIIDEREQPKFDFSDEEITQVLFSEENPIKLRDYQTEAVKIMLKNLNGVIKAGTGSGKSEIMAAWLKLTNLNSLILFKNIKLAHELHSRMTKAGIDCGLVQGTNIDEDHKVVMATVQSAHKLQRNDYEVIVVDEVHNASQERYQRVLKWDIFKYRFGFSATPFNKKNRLKSGGVKAWIGDLIVDVPAIELINKGHLARPKITFIKINKTIQNVKRQKTEKIVNEDGEVVKDKKVWYEKVEKHISPDVQWSSAERMGIVHNAYRNKIIETLANSLDGTVLVLVKYVDTHGEKLYKNINNSLFLSGKDKLKERIDAVDLLEKNEIKTIIASTIFDEGIDLKRVHNVILAGGGQSYERTLQRIGRGMRLFTDEDGVEKTSVKIFDFYDETHPTLEKHSKERIRYMEAEGYDVRIKEIDIDTN